MRMRLLLLFFISQVRVLAQQADRLSLADAYRLARENYPLSRQYELIGKSSQYSLENVGKAYFPQVSILGQASYQSDVTRLPISIPGQKVPEISKDQYRIYADINQLLYDGGSSRLQKLNMQNSYSLEAEKLETELYKLRERINQIYFGILLLDEQSRQLKILIKDIDTALHMSEVLLKNGVLLRSQLEVLKAERLKVEQKEIELRSARQSYLEMLAMFTRLPLNENTKLEKPAPVSPGVANSRAELLVFDRQKKLSEIQYGLINSRTLPRLSLYLQSGYGRPALNMLNNDFRFYYIGGVRFSWSLSPLYTASRDKAINRIGRQSIELQKETFIFNTELSLKQQGNEKNKLSELLRIDREILALRSSIRETALIQFQNGVIRSDDYLRELNAEDQARQNLSLHELQLLMTEHLQLITLGQ